MFPSTSAIGERKEPSIVIGQFVHKGSQSHHGKASIFPLGFMAALDSCEPSCRECSSEGHFPPSWCLTILLFLLQSIYLQGHPLTVLPGPAPKLSSLPRKNSCDIFVSGLLSWQLNRLFLKYICMCVCKYKCCILLNEGTDITYSLGSASQVALVVRNLPANAGDMETGVQSLGWEDPLEEGMAIHSSTLAWRIPWTEEPDSLQFMG